MPWHSFPIRPPDDVAVEIEDPVVPQPGLLVCDPPAQYRPRHPEFTAVYQLFEKHFDSYVRSHEERFEPRSGPLRRVVVESVEEFLSCGRLYGGFARIRCPKCWAEHLWRSHRQLQSSVDSALFLAAHPGPAAQSL